MGVAGGAAAAAWGQKVAKGAGRTFSGYNKAQRQVKAFAGERQRQINAGKAPSLGTRLGGATGAATLAGKSKLGLTKARRSAAGDAYQKHQQDLAEDAAKRNRINGQMTETDLRTLHEKARKKDDKALLAATTKEMVGRKEMAGEVTDGDVAAVKDFFKDIGGRKNLVAENVVGSVARHNAAAAYAGDAEGMRKAFEDGKIKIDEQSASGLTRDVLMSANAAGKLDQRQLADMNKDPAKSEQLKVMLPLATAAAAEAYKSKADAGKNTGEDDKSMQRMMGLHLAQTGKVHEGLDTHPELRDKTFTEVLKKADHETLKKMAKEDGDGFAKVAPQLLEATSANRTLNVLAKLSEEEGLDTERAIRNIKSAATTSRKAQSAVRMMEKDHRFSEGSPRREGGDSRRPPEDYIA